MQAQAIMYKAVVQTVLLYGSDIWVVTGEMLMVLEDFIIRSTVKFMIIQLGVLGKASGNEHQWNNTWR